jgi:hypothetical protein
MRKTLIALLLASVPAVPALADPDKDESGHGRGKKWHKVEREWRGDRGRDWQRPARFVRIDRDDDDDDDDDRWERRREWREDRRDRRRYERAVWRAERQRTIPREVIRYVPAAREIERYYDAPVRYARPVARYAEPAVRYIRPQSYADYDYLPTSYAPAGSGMFGNSGGGLLGGLLPVVLSGALGGGLGDLGGLGSLGGLTSLGGGLGNLGNLGGLGGLASPAVLPLDQLGYGYSQDYGYEAPLDYSYAGLLASGYTPASYSDFTGANGGLTSLLLPALLSSNGSLF